MKFTDSDKRRIKNELASCLSSIPEVRKVMVFGSFTTSSDPQDLDVAVFQDTDQKYLPLAMKYRHLLRSVADQIPLDVIPLRFGISGGQFLAEINKGEVVYERQL
jgi:predicted nucleotidyltransferase